MGASDRGNFLRMAFSNEKKNEKLFQEVYWLNPSYFSFRFNHRLAGKFINLPRI